MRETLERIPQLRELAVEMAPFAMWSSEGLNGEPPPLLKGVEVM